MTIALTLIADARPTLPDQGLSEPGPPDPVPPGYRTRPCRRADTTALARLYFEAYEPGQACASVAEAVADIEATWAGEYGELWPEASLVAPATAPDGGLAGAVLVVRRAPWSDTPDCPFVIELFTARADRRRGLARGLLRATLGVVADAGHHQLALRVAADNTAALALYRSLGFREWSREHRPARH